MNLQGNVGQVVSGALSGQLIKNIAEVNKPIKQKQEREDIAKENAAANVIAQQTETIEERKAALSLRRLNKYVAAHASQMRGWNGAYINGIYQPNLFQIPYPQEAKVRVGGNKGIE